MTNLVLVSACLAAANGGSIQLIPEYPVVQGAVTFNVTGITGNILSYTWYRGPSTKPNYQILSYPPHDCPDVKTLNNTRFLIFCNGSIMIFNLQQTDAELYTVKADLETGITQVSALLKINGNKVTVLVFGILAAVLAVLLLCNICLICKICVSNKKKGTSIKKDSVYEDVLNTARAPQLPDRPELYTDLQFRSEDNYSDLRH
ncbi:uncharacterized protein [Hyperolius riggenbachi]|uniref:uncharacterized protein isoform X2 n=1 Tax=Hyperolius riggenbachi TaxID=752182 RepID=UPI0035A2D6DC